jgi:hypothetical protein
MRQYTLAVGVEPAPVYPGVFGPEQVVLVLHGGPPAGRRPDGPGTVLSRLRRTV